VTPSWHELYDDGFSTHRQPDSSCDGNFDNSAWSRNLPGESFVVETNSPHTETLKQIQDKCKVLKDKKCKVFQDLDTKLDTKKFDKVGSKI
jgi:hypothetical protein